MRRRRSQQDPFSSPPGDRWAVELEGMLREWARLAPDWLQVEDHQLFGPTWVIPSADDEGRRSLVGLSTLHLLAGGVRAARLRYYCRCEQLNHASAWTPRGRYIAWVSRQGGERVRGGPHHREDFALLDAILTLLAS